MVVLTRRPALVKEVIEVDLPAVRDYSETMARPQFASATAHIRDLLGAVTERE